jgi:hypothetical protein
MVVFDVFCGRTVFVEKEKDGGEEILVPHHYVER